MELLLGFLTFILGLIVGSFLNVVILRYNTGVSVRGRSKCAVCSKTLPWNELVPVLSFIFQGGKCNSCKTKISWQYPLVELATGLLFLGVTLRLFTGSLGADFLGWLLFYFAVSGILIVITTYDFKHKIIPDPFVYALSALGLVHVAINFSFSLLLSGPVLALPFALLWFVSKGKWMGLGDAKLALALGWLLGLSEGIAAIVLSFWIGAAYALLLLFVKSVSKGGLYRGLEHFTIKSEIPFAPFMVLGFLVVFFLSLDISSISNLFIFLV